MSVQSRVKISTIVFPDFPRPLLSLNQPASRGFSLQRMAFSVYEVVCVACQLRIWFVNYATDKPARGTSVQFWLKCFRGTRLSCTQNAFFAYIH